MDKISPELAERMAACIQAYATGEEALRGAIIQATGRSIHAEFVAIADELPKPVDPDLIEARKIYSASSDGFWSAQEVMDGEADHAPYLKDIFRGVKRGRELAGGAA